MIGRNVLDKMEGYTLTPGRASIKGISPDPEKINEIAHFYIYPAGVDKNGKPTLTKFKLGLGH